MCPLSRDWSAIGPRCQPFSVFAGVGLIPLPGFELSEQVIAQKRSEPLSPQTLGFHLGLASLGTAQERSQRRATVPRLSQARSMIASSERPVGLIVAALRAKSDDRNVARLSENYRGPTTSCTSMTRSRFCAGSFRFRKLRFGRLPRSCEVAPKRRCHFRTTVRNCPTASRHCARALRGGREGGSDRRRMRAFRAFRVKRRGRRDACGGSKGGHPATGSNRRRRARRSAIGPDRAP